MVNAMQLSTRVATVAEETLSRLGRVSFLDVLMDLRWVDENTVDRWRRGEVDPLSAAMSVDEGKLREAFTLFEDWGRARFNAYYDMHYVSATRDRRILRFTADEDGDRLHLRYATDKWRANAEASRPDLVVLEARAGFECPECGREDDWVMMDAGTAICLSCADLDHLVFLPAGNATLSRRARKESSLTALAIRPDRRRNRTRRLGMFIEADALERAEQQCFDDEEIRARRRVKDAERRELLDEKFMGRFTVEIRLLFPKIPAERAEAIARHAALRGSGRVGRSAAGRALDERAVRHAVVASVRHEDTDYDALLMKGVPRQEARDRIWQRIDEVLTGWS